MMKSGIMKSTLAVMFLISLIYMSASEAQSQMDISVTKDADNAAPKEGEEIEYTIIVSNVGSESAFILSVADELPAGLTYITHSSDIGTATYDTQKGSISWDLAFFSSGTSATLTIRVSVDSNTAGTEITNTAKVVGVLPPDQNGGNNADDATISVQSEETHLEIEIDIKPGDENNSINLKSKGVIPVAILTTSDFDATTVDPSTVRFGRTGTEAAPMHEGGHIEDVNGDGDSDLLFHFSTQETGLQEGDTEAYLTGEILTVRALTAEATGTGGGQAISGCDVVKTSKKAPQLSGISRFATWGSIKTGN
jgi:uncharacterized repeat protein (TIGR01451 family)